jgi:hypothetical protein
MMTLSTELKQDFIRRYENAKENKSLDTLEMMALEAVITGIKLEPIIHLAETSINDTNRIYRATEGLLKILLGDDVDTSNIGSRFEILFDSIDDALQMEKDEESTTKSYNKSIVKLHLLMEQRLMASIVSGYINYYKLNWVEIDMDIKFLIFIFHTLLKFVTLLKITPTFIAFRSIPVIAIESVNLDVSISKLSELKNKCGTATLKIDLLQPKEAIMKSFEAFIDQSKSTMKTNPDNNEVLNLYDIRRKKDGRPDKSIYHDWYKAIIGLENGLDYESFANAADGLVRDDKDGSKSERLLRTTHNHARRFDSLVLSILNHRFPVID